MIVYAVKVIMICVNLIRLKSHDYDMNKINQSRNLKFFAIIHSTIPGKAYMVTSSEIQYFFHQKFL
jgi:hypothetical protein